MRSIKKQTANRRRAGAISILAAIVAAALFTAQVGHADDTGATGRAVNLSYVDGQVRVTQGGQVITEGATVNTPLFEGMQVSTAEDGRAEIEFEDGSVARLSPNTTITLTVLRGAGAASDTEILVNGGLAYFEFEGGDQEGQFTVRFGDSTVTPSGNAVVRIKMDTPPGELAVFSGNANLTRGNGAMQLAMHGGESVTLYAGDNSRYDLNESIDPDSWDAWNTDRDQVMATEGAAITDTGQNLGGPESKSPAWSDLDSNGSWYDVPGQGYMWSPFQASNPNWDPYTCGNWVWYPQYGYIFVPCESWGFLPYSCGSWNYFDSFGWGWMPGEGGCSPWWYGGGGYYGPRFGAFLPPGYRAPHRPLGPPRGRFPGHPVPVIAVNRPIRSGAGGELPSRERNTPVTIGSVTVSPIHPVGPREGVYGPPSGTRGLGYTIYDPSSHSASSAGRPVYTAHPAAPGGSPGEGLRSSSTIAPTGAARSSSSDSAPHGYSGGAQHSSSGGGSYHPSGGGGGGGYHASSGGGGGGGHAGGGGGGGHSGGGGGGSHK